MWVARSVWVSLRNKNVVVHDLPASDKLLKPGQDYTIGRKPSNADDAMGPDLAIDHAAVTRSIGTLSVGTLELSDVSNVEARPEVRFLPFIDDAKGKKPFASITPAEHTIIDQQRFYEQPSRRAGESEFLPVSEPIVLNHGDAVRACKSSGGSMCLILLWRPVVLMTRTLASFPLVKAAQMGIHVIDDGGDTVAATHYLTDEISADDLNVYYAIVKGAPIASHRFFDAVIDKFDRPRFDPESLEQDFALPAPESYRPTTADTAQALAKCAEPPYNGRSILKGYTIALHYAGSLSPSEETRLVMWQKICAAAGGKTVPTFIDENTFPRAKDVSRYLRRLEALARTHEPDDPTVVLIVDKAENREKLWWRTLSGFAATSPSPPSFSDLTFMKLLDCVTDDDADGLNLAGAAEGYIADPTDADVARMNEDLKAGSPSLQRREDVQMQPPPAEQAASKTLKRKAAAAGDDDDNGPPPLRRNTAGGVPLATPAQAPPPADPAPPVLIRRTRVRTDIPTASKPAPASTEAGSLSPPKILRRNTGAAAARRLAESAASGDAESASLGGGSSSVQQESIVQKLQRNLAEAEKRKAEARSGGGTLPTVGEAGEEGGDDQEMPSAQQKRGTRADEDSRTSKRQRQVDGDLLPATAKVIQAKQTAGGEVAQMADTELLSALDAVPKGDASNDPFTKESEAKKRSMTAAQLKAALQTVAAEEREQELRVFREHLKEADELPPTGNYMAVDFVELYRKERAIATHGLPTQKQEWEGRPNFKRFRANRQSEHLVAQLVALELDAPVDFGMGAFELKKRGQRTKDEQDEVDDASASDEEFGGAQAASGRGKAKSASGRGGRGTTQGRAAMALELSDDSEDEPTTRAASRRGATASRTARGKAAATQSRSRKSTSFDDENEEAGGDGVIEIEEDVSDGIADLDLDPLMDDVSFAQSIPQLNRRGPTQAPSASARKPASGRRGASVADSQTESQLPATGRRGTARTATPSNNSSTVRSREKTKSAANSDDDDYDELQATQASGPRGTKRGRSTSRAEDDEESDGGFKGFSKKPRGVVGRTGTGRTRR